VDKVKLSRPQLDKAPLDDPDVEALWAKFHASIHKAQKGSNHPVETLQALSAALAALGEGLHQMLLRLADRRDQ